MLQELELKIGNKIQRELSLKPATMNIIVGPNHSGKSRLLLEIKGYIESYSTDKQVKFNNRYAPVPKNEFVILKSLQIRIQKKGALKEAIQNRLYEIVTNIKNDGDEKTKQASQWINLLIEAKVKENQRQLSFEQTPEIIQAQKEDLEKLQVRLNKFIGKYGTIWDYLEKDILKWKPLLKWMDLFSEEEIYELEGILEKIKQKLNSNDITVILKFFGVLLEPNGFSKFIEEILDKKTSVLLKQDLNYYIDKTIKQANRFLDVLESLSTEQFLDELISREIIDINSNLDLCAEYMLYIDGANRFEYAKGWPISEIKLDQKPARSNHFIQFLHPDYSKNREKFRNIIYEIFGYYPVFDQRSLKNIYLLFSKKHPKQYETRFQEKEAMEYLEKECITIDYFSDGIRALSGMLAKVLSDEYDLILIDEPDAFLHPPLARKFGKLLTEYTNELDGNTFIATHSPEFLMGCIDSGREINIIRLTYNEVESTANVLDYKKIRELMNQPLLRSTRFLEGLFYSGVVICEADADRCFYEEINHRLLNEKKGRGEEGVLFLNAQNKQTIHKLMKPLSEMGIPTACIVDIDVLNPVDKTLEKLLEVTEIENREKEDFTSCARECFNSLKDKEKEYKKQGIYCLENQLREKFQKELFYKLEQKGIFVVECGELESWLPNLKREFTEGKKSSNKTDHFIATMEALGSDPNSENYIKPDHGDVWDFVDKVVKLIYNKKPVTLE